MTTPSYAPPFRLPFSADRRSFLDRVFGLARAMGGEARLVGGVVRNGLLARHHGHQFDPDQDLDLAVNLPITAVAAAARTAGLSVYETGLAHGTITLRCADQSAEVTQLRCDTQTDGRHAVIKATQSWDEDARRRDFTLNALYLDSAGQLYDPVGGLADLVAGRLRFVGTPARRLAEDHLRLLRALRFLASYPGLVMPAADKQALAGHVHHLPALSAERIATELNRLMAGPAALPVLGLAADMGVDRVLFDSPLRASLLGQDSLIHLWPELGFAQRLACCLGPGQRGPAALRLKLSRADRKFLQRTDLPASLVLCAQLFSEHWARSAYRLGPAAFIYALDHACQTGQMPAPDRLRQIVFFQPPPCPVKGRDIVHYYRLGGTAVGLRLAALEQLWVDTDFTLSADQLLALYDKNKSSTSS